MLSSLSVELENAACLTSIERAAPVLIFLACVTCARCCQRSLQQLVCNHNNLIAGRRGKNVKSKYKAVVGCTIDVPAPIFGVDIPDLYYRGTVLKKDPAHAGKLLLSPPSCSLSCISLRTAPANATATFLQMLASRATVPITD